jgi:hypothetical protein
MKKTILASCCTSAGLLALASQSAQANSTFEFYGQLNFGVFYTDDGSDNETYFTDNDNSNTRIGFNWSNDYGGGRSIRFNFETGVGLNGSSAVTIDDTDLDFDWEKTELRKFEFIYTTPDAGTLSFGQGSTASDGTSEADFSGTSVIAYAGIADLAGNIEYRNPDGSFSGIAVGDTFKSFDGNGRRFRVRYDTPSFSGFVFSISGGEEVLADGNDNEYYDVGAKYAADYGDIRVDARLGYSWISGGEELLSGSVAGLHSPTGLSLALSAGAEQEGDASYIYAKLGWEQQWLSQGSTAFSIDYNDGSDYAIDGSDSTSVGLAVVQNIDAYNLELYGAWRVHEFDAPGERFDDVDVFAIGARWKF